MFDRIIALSTLNRINDAIIDIQKWTEGLNNTEGFTHSEYGMVLLNAVCMKLHAIGESVKFRQTD